MDLIRVNLGSSCDCGTSDHCTCSPNDKMDITVNGKPCGEGAIVFNPKTNREEWAVRFMGRDFDAMTVSEVRRRIEVMFIGFDSVKVIA